MIKIHTMESNSFNALPEEVMQKEMLQQKHYFYLNVMQDMARELPLSYQQRLPYELLSSLASSLLDSTVFDIVRGLKEIQQMTEKSLDERRRKTINKHKYLMDELKRKSKEQVATEAQIRDLEKWIQDEERRLDMKIITELDQTVSDQQVTLEKAGVPGFFVTNNPNEIRLQMYLLEFITQASHRAFPHSTDQTMCI